MEFTKHRKSTPVLFQAAIILSYLVHLGSMPGEYILTDMAIKQRNFVRFMLTTF